MSDVSGDIALLLVRELEGFKREIAMFPDDDSAWRRAPGVTNSAANLALHVAGNLQYFIGVVLGGSAYVRRRDLEFGRTSGTRASVIAETDAAIAVVRSVLPALSGHQLADIFPEPVTGRRLRTEVFLLHLCAHAAFHLGQAGYVRRIVTGDSRTSGPIPLEPLEEPSRPPDPHFDRDTTS